MASRAGIFTPLTPSLMGSPVNVWLDKDGKLASHDVMHPTNRFIADVDVVAKYPALCTLVIGSETMDDNEKQYWLDIMPSMNSTQIDRLFYILDTEKIKLAELEARYQEEIRKLNEDHLKDWALFQNKIVEGAEKQLAS